MKTRGKGKSKKPSESAQFHRDENDEQAVPVPHAQYNSFTNTSASPTQSSHQNGRRGTDVSTPLQNSPSKRLKGGSSSSSLEAMSKSNRIDLITKALIGYSDDIENLFTVGTWKYLLKKAITGTKDDRKYKNDERLTRLAEVTIEQITESSCSEKISKILASCRTRNNRNGINAQKFLKLCDEYEAKKSNSTWNKAIGDDSFPSEEGWIVDEGDKYDGPLLNTDQLCNLNSSCEVSEDEIEEKENTSSKITTRGGLRAQNSQSLRNGNKQSSQKPLAKTPSQQNGKFPSIKGTGTYRTRQCSVSLESIKENPILARLSPVDALERPPIIDQYNENADLKPSLPVFQLSLNTDDEIIENETPPPTPLSEDLASDPIPYKRTRYSSCTIKDENPLPANRTSRFRSQPIMKTTGGRDSPSVRSNRCVGDTGMVDRYGDFDYLSMADDADDKDDIKNSDDLPNLEPPEQDKENLPISEQEILRDYPKPPSCPELKPHMFEDIGEALSRPKKDKILTGFALTIRQEHLAVYNKAEWLEDVNIDFYLELIKDRNNRDDCQYPTVYVYHSYFYKLLEKRGYEAVQGATSKDNIFAYNLVLIPIHVNHHWILIVVDFRKKSMTCYDSMDHNNENQLKIVSDYILQEWKERRRGQSDETESNGDSGEGSDKMKDLFANPDSDVLDELYEGWDLKDLGAESIPQQTNGRDCGVFCLQFAEYLSRDHTFDFEQRHTAYFRKRMLFETLKKCLLIS